MTRDRQHAPQPDEDKVIESAKNKYDTFRPGRAVGRILNAEAVETQIRGLSNVRLRLGASSAKDDAPDRTKIAVYFVTRDGRARHLRFFVKGSDGWRQYDYTLEITTPRPNSDQRRKNRAAGKTVTGGTPSRYRWRDGM